MTEPASEIASAPSISVRSKIEKGILGLLGLIVALVSLHFPAFGVHPGLDASWVAGLNYAFVHHFRFGNEFVFTYGPLGMLYVSEYLASAFWWQYFYAIGLALVFTLGVAKVSRPLNFWYRIILFVLMIWLIPIVSLEVIYFSILLVWGIRLLDSNVRASERAFCFFWITVFSLIKFTFFLYGICLLAVVTVFLLLDRKRNQAIQGLFFTTVFFLALWLGLGQHIVDFWRFLHGSLEVAGGYSEAMALWGRHNEIGKGLVILTAWLALFIPIFIKSQNERRARVFLCGLIAFLAWKEGFVRQDLHTAVFFGFAVLFSALLPVIFWETQKSSYQRGVIFVSFFISVIGLFAVWKKESPPGQLASQIFRVLPKNLGELSFPQKLRRRCEAEKTANETLYALPGIRKLVGDSTVDLISYEQGAIFLNHLNWRPRPVFQSYSAYTAYLQQVNALFFESPAAPEYILFKSQVIDGRYPTSEEGPTLIEMLSRYHPVGQESGYLILKKKSQSKIASLKFELPGAIDTIRFGENLPVYGNEIRPLQWAAIHLHYTWFGKIMKFLYKSGEVYLTARISDGRTLKFRILPATVGVGFLISPFLETTNDFLKLYRGTLEKRVVSFSLSVAPGKEYFYKNEIPVEITPLR